VKEIDFLPEWYREGRRRQSQMRKQYAGLVLVFLGMMTFNLTATQRASKAAAELSATEDARMRAEAVVHEFEAITNELSELKVRARLMEQTDSKINVAAILAETSHLIDESIVLRRLEFVAEPFSQWSGKEETKRAVVRPATGAEPKAAAFSGDVVFRIVLAGVAARPAQVADLVCRLDESAYFRRVYPSFSRNTTITLGGRAPSKSQANTNAGGAPDSFEVTEFEISCYLANFEDIESR